MIDNAADPELPRGIALAWGVAANPQRGPKREMSVERIVDTAVELADAGGISAVSMSSVASALGFTPMALYRYVTAKDDLVLLMQERGVGVPPENISECDTWRDGLRAWAAAQRDVYTRHPWLLDIPISGTPLTPNNLAWLDSGLTLFTRIDLDYSAKVAIILGVMGQVRWEGIVGRGYREASEAAGTTVDVLEGQGVTILEFLVTAEEFPEVSRALDAGVFAPDPAGDVDDPFAFGLDRYLDGVDRFVVDRPVIDRSASDPMQAELARDPKVKEASRARRELEKQLRDARKRERQVLGIAREKLERKAGSA